MIGVYLVGFFCGFAAAIAAGYIIGYKRDRKALPPHDPNRD